MKPKGRRCILREQEFFHPPSGLEIRIEAKNGFTKLQILGAQGGPWDFVFDKDGHFMGTAGGASESPGSDS